MSSDVLHQSGEHPDWNESFYFNFYDRKMDIFAFMRIGLKPNRNEKNAFCFLMMPDGSIVGMRGQEPANDTELKVGKLNFERIVPERKWHLTFSGAMEKRAGDVRMPETVFFSADFECLNAAFDYRECVSGAKEKISKSIASQHFEQFGRVRGQLNLGGNEYALDGLGERDHSWGVRDWNAPKMWIWLTCQFSERFALNVTKLIMDAGEVDAGFIHLHGRNLALARADIRTEWTTKGSPARLDIRIEDKAGRTREVRAEVMREATLPFAGAEGSTLSILHEPLAKYTTDSEIGYGVAEYLVRKT